MPLTETMLTILPHFLCSIPRTTALVMRKAPFRSTSMTASQSSSFRNGKSASLMMPALLTRMSAPPKSFVTLSPRVLTAAASRTSASTACASPSFRRISSAAASARARSLWQVMTIRFPAAASSREIAQPIQREPPVTMAVLIGPCMTSSVWPQYTRHLADGRQGAGGMAGHAPVDPPHDLRQHLSGSDLEKHAVAVADHRLDGHVPLGWMAELRCQEPRNAGARGLDVAVGPVIGNGWNADRAARRDDRRDRGSNGLHQLAVDRPAHRQRKDSQGARRESLQGGLDGRLRSGQDELRVRVDVADPDGQAPFARILADRFHGFPARADDGTHRAADAEPLGFPPDRDQDVQSVLVGDGPGGGQRRVVAEAVTRGGRGCHPISGERSGGEGGDQIDARLRREILVECLLRSGEEDLLEVETAFFRCHGEELAGLEVRVVEVAAHPGELRELAGEEEGRRKKVRWSHRRNQSVEAQPVSRGRTSASATQRSSASQRSKRSGSPRRL